MFGEAGLPRKRLLSAPLFLLVSEELLEAGLFVQLIEKALESARLLFGLAFLLSSLIGTPQTWPTAQDIAH